MNQSFVLLALAFATPAHTQSLVRPWYGTWGFDLAGRDTTVRPGDDFFMYAGGAWLARTPIPPDRARIGLSAYAADTTESRLHRLLEHAAKQENPRAKTIEAKIGRYYRAFMDSSAVERLGASPLKSVLAEVRSATTHAAIAGLMGRNPRDFNGSLFVVAIDVDLKDPSRYALYVGQAGLGMPDRDYYLKADFAAQRAEYQRYVSTLLKLLSWPDADVRARDVLALETAVAEVSWTKVQQRDPVATYNAMSMADLQQLAPAVDWSAFFKSAGIPAVKRVVVAEKSAFPKISAIFARTPVPVLQAWQAFTIADNAAAFLSTPFVNAQHEMRAHTLSGVQVLAPRWKRAVRAISGGDFALGDRFVRFGSVGFGVGELYTAEYFPPTAKTKIVQLVTNVKAAYRARIETLDWMSAATRAEALKKLETYVIKVGYPDTPRDYSKLVITANELLGNARRAGALDWQFYVDRMKGPVDRGDWSMTPQTLDAYNGALRDIVFPAAILQPPIFDPNADPAVNYGGAGAVIGHELTHGFDDQGRKIDATGKLRDWWQPSDAQAFLARARRLSAQYSAFEALPGVHVNGDLTLGENIADLGGLQLAADAYHASLKGRSAAVLDGLSGDQRVFLGWAQGWRTKLTDDALRQRVLSDPHSPYQFRVNGPVRNIDAWYTAFSVSERDRLFLPLADRVRIW